MDLCSMYLRVIYFFVMNYNEFLKGLLPTVVQKWKILKNFQTQYGDTLY